MRVNLSQNGNALIYVLIAIVLFAALGFTLTRQVQNTGTREIDRAEIDLYALQLITYSAQATSSIEQMRFSGSDADDLIFVQPAESGYSSAPHIHKVFHPQGGGLNPQTLPADTVLQVAATPPAGWYLGRFNNVEWTPTNAQDVILSAYQISRPLCETINQRITGNTSIPALSGSMSTFLVDSGTNSDLNIANCAACEGYVSLCVSNDVQTSYSFYTIIESR
ncbi:MAG: hypothetical protein ACRBCK_02300 [Alphaproteobacteria bacterium]